MNPRKYFTYSIVGGVLWATGVTLLGFWLGRITFIKDNVELILVGIVALSIIPIVIETLKVRKRSRLTDRG